MNLWNRLPNDRLLVDVSLWSADLTALGCEIQRLETLADLLHFDVADAHFVPGLLFFPDLVAALRASTSIPFHVHLMVEQPLDLIDDFIEAGSDIVTIHFEVGDQVPKALRSIRDRGCAAGLSLRLDTPIEAAIPYLDLVDLVLLMGTDVGVKGANLDSTAEKRIESLRFLLRQCGHHQRVKIEADGGLRRHTVPGLRAAGADLISPGSLVFGSPDLREVFSWLHSLPGRGEVQDL